MALPAWSGPFTSSPWRDQSVGYARLVTGPFTSEGFASFTKRSICCGVALRLSDARLSDLLEGRIRRWYAAELG